MNKMLKETGIKFRKKPFRLNIRKTDKGELTMIRAFLRKGRSGPEETDHSGGPLSGPGE